MGAVIIFLSEHNSALDLSPALAFSPSVDIVFIVSLVNTIILLCQPKNISAATLMQPAEFHSILLLTEMQVLCCLRDKKGNFLTFLFSIYFCQSMEFITLVEQWPPEWQTLISETIIVVPTPSLWPHQIIIMAASQGKKKEPFLLLFFYLVSVT